MLTQPIKKLFPLTLILLLAGCGDKYPQVSGRVTIEGQPVADVNVLFVPVSTNDNPFPGPIAEAVTNQDGKYSLVTTSGIKGGTPGLNVVEFYLVGALELDFMSSNAIRLITEADGNVTHPSYIEGQQLKAKIESLKAVATGDKMKPGAKTEFTVPAEGTESANFELNELVETK